MPRTGDAEPLAHADARIGTDAQQARDPVSEQRLPDRPRGASGQDAVGADGVVSRAGV
jgi:hypothetical protein